MYRALQRQRQLFNSTLAITQQSLCLSPSPSSPAQPGASSRLPSPAQPLPLPLRLTVSTQCAKGKKG